MLNQHTIDVIKSTVPVLEVHGTAITTTFYQRMFAAHPELLNIFNHANQKQGRQQAALANAVYAAAKHIDQLENILPVVKQIAHKHRSLGIKPEHYPIVGEHLLAAIAEVLGDAATDEILQAWTDAYGVIADAFIGVEAGMYEEARTQKGGWEGFRSFRVERKVRESEMITSFYLVPADGGVLASFQPGQYISVKIFIPGEAYTHLRQYSLSDSPDRPYYRISVKREDARGERPAGKVSTYLHEQVQEGDVLELSAPAGEFVLDEQDTRPVVFISGGVGLTPMVSMFNTLAKRSPERPAVFLHAAQNSQYHAMREAVEQLVSGKEHSLAQWVYTSPTEEDRAAASYHKEGYMDLEWLRSVVPNRDAVFYFCGPVPFMRTINQALHEWGVPEKDIHFEFFGPAAALN
ncbi:NO-inducible flavohemoprotein [Paenibacillus sp. JX-17]|uniref:Flavohemoprotein n=1 Tax=Paenibacillus lacisoli TaxID=3064525 RepID=A0ABT9CCQ7_9BACL|nr:NO-inducible flavohemoprotein [Paenibacillus sp. JX-17]MDO7907021.1 NO-inducible flavohemoprotein [Paenibacillus sp. JX-17]